MTIFFFVQVVPFFASVAVFAMVYIHTSIIFVCFFAGYLCFFWQSYALYGMERTGIITSIQDYHRIQNYWITYMTNYKSHIEVIDVIYSKSMLLSHYKQFQELQANAINNINLINTIHFPRQPSMLDALFSSPGVIKQTLDNASDQITHVIQCLE